MRSDPWIGYGTIHRLWRETATTASGQKQAGDHHYIDFARAVGELAEEQLTQDIRASLMALIDELAGAFTQAAVERLIDEALDKPGSAR